LGTSPLTVISIPLFNYLLEKYLSPNEANCLTTSVSLGLNVVGGNPLDLTRASMTIAGNIAGNYAYSFVKKGFGFFTTKSDTAQKELVEVNYGCAN
jgi:hypothetical protein